MHRANKFFLIFFSSLIIQSTVIYGMENKPITVSHIIIKTNAGTSVVLHHLKPDNGYNGAQFLSEQQTYIPELTEQRVRLYAYTDANADSSRYSGVIFTDAANRSHVPKNGELNIPANCGCITLTEELNIE